MIFERILRKASLGFLWPQYNHLNDGWYDILSQRPAVYPARYFETGKTIEVLHPQLIFGRNRFSDQLANYYRSAPHPNDMFLPCLIGYSESGLVYHDFAKDVIHLLLSGITGSGKTSAVYDILFSLMWLNLPIWLRISIFAAKDFAFFKEIANVYTTIDEIRQGAEALAKRLEERSQQLNSNGSVHNISMFNRQNRSSLMRYEVVVFDEFANILRALDGEHREAFIANVAQIASQGRSVGMHLIVMPQRPDREGIPSSIKSQLVSSLTFKLKTSIDAQTADCPEAVDLKVGQGVLNSNAGIGRLNMLHMPEQWPPFFCDRIKKTMHANGFLDCFK